MKIKLDTIIKLNNDEKYVVINYLNDEGRDFYLTMGIIKDNEIDSSKVVIIEELKDRFGDVPRETRNLIKIARIKGLADELRVRRIFEQNKHMVFTFDQFSKINAESIVMINAEYGGRSFIHGGNKPYIRILVDPNKILDETLKLLILLKGDKADAV